MFNQAEDCYIQYIELVENNLGFESASASNSYFTLANYYFKRGKINKAKMCFEKSLEIRKKLVEDHHIAIVDCETNISVCMLELKDYDEALAYLKNLIEKVKLRIGKKNEHIARIYQILAFCLQCFDRYDQADKYLRLATDIRKKLHGDNKEGANSKLNEYLNQQINYDLTNKYLDMFKKSFKEFEKVKKSTNTYDKFDEF